MSGRHTVSGKLASEWQAKRLELVENGQELAGVFLGYVPEQFGESGKRVLYIGQATSGAFDEVDPHPGAFDGSHAFWSFARSFASAIAPGMTPHSCVAWSTISKLARVGISPDPSLLTGLEDLAARTSVQEIATTCPNVVVFVSHHFGENILRDVVESVNPSDWYKSEDESSNQEHDDVWWKQPTLGAPAIVWRRHPRSDNKQRLDYSAKLIARLHP